MRSFAGSGQHSTNKHTSSDGFIKCGEFANLKKQNKKTAVFQTFLPISDPELSAAVELISLTWCGPPGMRKYFDIINFFRRRHFTLGLCHGFSRVSFHSGGGSCEYYDSIVGLTICQTLSRVFWIMVNCWTVTLVATVQSSRLSHWTLLYQFDTHF